MTSKKQSVLAPINNSDQHQTKSINRPLLHFKNDMLYSKNRIQSLNPLPLHGLEKSSLILRQNRQQTILQEYVSESLDQNYQSKLSDRSDKQQKKVYIMSQNLMNNLNQMKMPKNQKSRFGQSGPSSLLEKENKLSLLPLCLGLIKMNGDTNILNLNNYNLGDRYVIALGAGLKQVKFIQKCYLSSNRITDVGLSAVINNISADVMTLDFSNNKIINVDKKLLEMIIENQYRLEELNLRNNLIKEASIEAILRNTCYSKHLRKLNLSKNKLTINCIEAVVDMIQKSQGLEELYIGCNYLSAKCGQKIFKELTNNTKLKVLDYSLNQLGQEEDLSCAKAISNCFRTNKTLHHIDLSFNNINKEATEIITQGLYTNHTIYGIHYQGNHGWINSQGFLINQQLDSTCRDSIKQNQIHSYQITKIREVNPLHSSLYRHVCWICQGWHQQEFELNVEKTQQKVLVHIHFDFQSYEPRLIGVNQFAIKYTTMVPPKRYKYFYTVNGISIVDPQQPIQHVSIPEIYQYQMNHQMQDLKVEKVNVVSGKACKIVNQWDQIIIRTKPRMIGLSNKKEKDPWSYEKSVWAKQWKMEDQELLRKCFQRDWSHSKISNIVKTQADQDLVKQILWKNYSGIKNIYRHFSSWSPVGDVWSITSQPFTQFCQQSKLICKDLPLKITDLTFITTNSMSGVDWRGNVLVPQRGLVRFQFMESLVRLAEQKYKKNGIFETYSESIQKVLKQYVLPLMKLYDSTKWRLTTYFTQFNDELIKKYRPILNYVYKKNSKLKVKPGEKAFMCLAQFRSILQRVSQNSCLGQRDIFLSYNQGMMTQIDEVQSERFLKMSEIQFIQALARYSFALPAENTLAPGKTQIHYKYQWLITKLKTLCNQDLKNQFPDGQSSMFDQKQQQ